MNILAEISTKGRYDTTLPMALTSVALQTRKPNEFILFDDNENPRDLREIPIYQYIFSLFDNKGIKWSVVYGEKKGQHYNHEKANILATDLVWRLDDDCIAEPNVLQKLVSHMTEDVGAVGGLILDPKNIQTGTSTGKIENVNKEPNMQWLQGGKGYVEHLYSSFIYRKGIANYDLRLSPVAHREETMFTHEIFKKGYKLYVTDQAITWHFRNPIGGIRESKQEDFLHDESIFNQWLGIKDKTVAVLDAGLGDHIVFRKLIDDLDIKDITVAACYPEVFEGFNVISISDAHNLFGNLDRFNIYKWMDQKNWKDSLYNAFKKFYDFASSSR